jgi:uncharacterized membrane protein YjjP (DUF1212 family)
MRSASIIAGYIALVLWIVAIISAFAAIWAISDPKIIEKAWTTSYVAVAFGFILTVIWKVLPHTEMSRKYY